MKKILGEIAASGRARDEFIAKARNLGIADDLDGIGQAFRNSADDYAKGIANNADDFARAVKPVLSPGKILVRTGAKFAKAAPLIGRALDIGLGLASGEDVPRSYFGLVPMG